MASKAQRVGVAISGSPVCRLLVLAPFLFLNPAGATGEPGTPCRILADQRLEQPVTVIAGEYGRRTGTKPTTRFLEARKVVELVEAGRAGCDVVLCLSDKDEQNAVNSLPGARKVAWKYPGGSPVWAAVVTDHPGASAVAGFFGGPTGHRLWSESPSGFTMTSGKSHAEAFKWVADNRVAHTYPLTAKRMLRECGGITEGICIDIGCGTGRLDVALANISRLTIIGLDIDPDMKPLFDAQISEAGLGERARFVEGDAQKLPFPDDHADIIVSRGTLTFVPDIAQCLREVRRVLKPTGTAFLGGRYLYTPQADKITTDKLREIVAGSGVPGARVIDERGQWVKITGPESPKAAREASGSPAMLADRFLADYAITEGEALLIAGSDASSISLQRGFLDTTNLKITTLYPKEQETRKALGRIKAEELENRIHCRTGTIHDLPFGEAAFDLVAGVGPMLLWGDREKGMKEVHRVLKEGGAALVGGRFLGMPAGRKTSSETLRASAKNTGIPSIQVSDDMGQWVEIRKGVKDRGLRD